MRAAADLHIATDRRRCERPEQPGGVSIGAHAVPLAANDRHRRAHTRGLVREITRPGTADVEPGPARRLHAGRRSRPAGRVAVQPALAPFSEMSARQHGQFAGRHLRGEALPLILQRNQTPCRVVLRRTAVAPRDGAEQHEPIDQTRAACREATGHDRAPGMRDDGNPLDRVMPTDEPHCLFQLLAGILRGAERLASIRRRRHGGIRIRMAVAMKIQTPDIEARGA